MGILLLALGEGLLDEAQLERLRSALPADMRLLMTTQKDEIMPVAADIDIAAGWIDREWLYEFPNIGWVHQWWAGTDWLLKHPELVKRPFVLTNAAGVSAIPMSEHILGMMLYHSRYFRNAINAQRAKAWAHAKFSHELDEDDADSFNFSWSHVSELAGQTILLVGVGAIGQRVARLAKAFEMTVIGVRNDPSKTDPNVDKMVGTGALREVLPEADFIVTTVPMTEASRHQFGPAEFKAMRPTAFFINLGRGGTVDEAALIDALQRGDIAGAGLDVFETEPLAQESPLWGLENVLITSHYSGGTNFFHKRGFEIFLDNLNRYQNGEPLRNLVVKERGY